MASHDIHRTAIHVSSVSFIGTCRACTTIVSFKFPWKDREKQALKCPVCHSIVEPDVDTLTCQFEVA